MSGFWNWSLSVYPRDGVAPFVIALQDEHGVDVDLALFCCWVGLALDAPHVAEADALVAEWRTNVIQPLRAVRRWLKGREEVIRKQVQAQELAAEQREHAMLEEWARARWPEAGTQPGVAAEANLRLLHPAAAGLAQLIAPPT